MLTFLHQTADSVNDGARRATFHYESSHAALLLIICMRCETWTTAKVLTLKHLTGSIIFTRVCVFNELLFHMLHETLYGFFFFKPKFFLKLPWIFPCREEKRATSLPVAVLAADNTTLFWLFFPTLVVGKSLDRRIGIISKTESSSVMPEKHEDDGAHWIISFN